MRRIHFVPALLAAVVTIAAAVPAAAVQSNLTIFLDFDNDASTGCNDPASGFQGYTQRVVTTVETTTGPNAAIVTQIEGFDCSNAQVFFDGTDHPVGIGNGDLGLNVIETFWPIVEFPPPAHPCRGGARGSCLRIGVFAENANGGTDTLFSSDGGPAGPEIVFFFGGIADIPTLSQWGLLFLVLLLAGAAARKLRRQPLRALLLVLLVLGAGGVAYAVLGDLDGNTLEEWPPGSRIAHDPAATDDGDDIASLYARVQPSSARVFFRIDASLVFNSAPTANPQSVSFNEDSTNNPITLTGSDPDSDPLTFTIVPASGPTNGTLGGTPPNVTYTPNPNFNGSDSFDFQVDDGNGGTDTATVSITVNSVNDAPAPSGGPFSVAEGTPNGTNVGVPVAANDPDTGQTHTWAITAGNTGGAFAIDGAGQITVANSGAIDFETTPTYSLTVEATDNGTPVLSGTGTVVVNVSDVNDAAGTLGWAVLDRREQRQRHRRRHAVAATDPDAGQTHTWAITAGNTGGAFAIDAATGQITVANSGGARTSRPHRLSP